jgi:hypothetical protein
LTYRTEEARQSGVDGAELSIKDTIMKNSKKKPKNERIQARTQTNPRSESLENLRAPDIQKPKKNTRHATEKFIYVTKRNNRQSTFKKFK